MVGSTFTYLLGSDAAALLFNSKNEDLNAEDVYSRLTTPVFGKGVAYDVPNPVSSKTRRWTRAPRWDNNGVTGPNPPNARFSLWRCRSSWNRRRC